MPTRLCSSTKPPCPEPAVYRGYCKAHAMQRNRETHTNRHIYNSKRWRILRKKILFESPICQNCDQQLATDVDHIKPIEQGGAAWSKQNLQALCHQCHSTKTKQDMSTQ